MKSETIFLETGRYPSPPVWGAWIEMRIAVYTVNADWSPPVWGAWIEMRWPSRAPPVSQVAPRMGGVD